MTVTISVLPFLFVGEPDLFISTPTLDSTVDTDWQLGIEGSFNNGERPFRANYVIVDNMANDANVIVRMLWTITVPPYSRETLKIPAGLQRIDVNVTVGSIVLTFSTNNPELGDQQAKVITATG